MAKPSLVNTGGIPPERVDAIVAHVRASVTDMALIDSVYFVPGSHVVLELKSNVQRVVSWPRGV